MYLYLYSYRRETARQLRIYAQLTRCFSAVAELLVYAVNKFELSRFCSVARRLANKNKNSYDISE